jgi:hypothetical protein
MGEHLRDSWTPGCDSRRQPAVWQRAEQVDQNATIPIPRIQNDLEQVVLVGVSHPALLLPQRALSSEYPADKEIVAVPCGVEKMGFAAAQRVV